MAGATPPKQAAPNNSIQWSEKDFIVVMGLGAFVVSLILLDDFAPRLAKVLLAAIVVSFVLYHAGAITTLTDQFRAAIGQPSKAKG